jgi:hypothetical protein
MRAQDQTRAAEAKPLGGATAEGALARALGAAARVLGAPGGAGALSGSVSSSDDDDDESDVDDDESAGLLRHDEGGGDAERGGVLGATAADADDDDDDDAPPPPPPPGVSSPAAPLRLDTPSSILSDAMLRQLRDALPSGYGGRYGAGAGGGTFAATAFTNRWRLVFSLARDGASLATLCRWALKR